MNITYFTICVKLKYSFLTTFYIQMKSRLFTLSSSLGTYYQQDPSTMNYVGGYIIYLPAEILQK